jgi:internalin A
VDREKLQQLIRQVKTEGRTYLDLSFAQLTDDIVELSFDAETLPSVRSLILRTNLNITDAAIRVFVQRLPNLTDLDLEWCNKITDGAVREIARSLSKLTSLRLKSCWPITDAAAQEITQSLPFLTSLDMEGCWRITDIAVQEIAQGLPNLTSLNVASTKITDMGVKCVTKRLSKLTALNLARNDRITDAAIRDVVQCLTKLTSLHLGGTEITDASVRQVAQGLPNLTDLDLDMCRQITNAAILEVAHRLTNLTSLSLRCCESDETVREIARHLTKLTILNLNCEQITDVAMREVAHQLRNLSALDLHSCEQITDAAMCEVAHNLTNLTTLSLQQCRQITDLALQEIGQNLSNLITLIVLGCRRITRLPESIGQLAALKTLILGNTSLAELPESLRSLKQLQKLTLHGDNAALGLPKELLRQSDAAAILRFYFRGTREGKRQLNEAKLVVVGNEAAGKTSLVNFLIKCEPCRPGQAKTAGVNILERISVANWNLDKDNADSGILRLNVWDFGGQEVMHQTHKFFLTERSLYLLVLEARRQNVTDNDDLVHDWMRLIRNRAGDVPVIVVINKSEPPQEIRLDERSLMREYPNIQQFIRTSCLDPNEKPGVGGTGINELRGLIERTAREKLAHVHDWFPTNYFQVKETLGQRARQESVLDSHAYRTLCEQNHISEEDEQNSLLRLLDAIGVVVAYDATTLLDPNWLTTAIYRLLMHADVAKANGEFAFNDIRKLLAGLPEEKYPQKHWQFIIDLMERFGLCFTLSDCHPARYLIPEQLSPNEPETNFDEAACLRFAIDYDALPHGLIPQFIVRAHDLLTNKPTAWANGAVLRTNDCMVLVRADRKRHRVNLFVAGPAARRRSALAVVRDRFAVVHKRNKELNPKEMVPLPDQPELAADYRWLVQHEDIHKEFCLPLGADREYSVAQLLNGVDEGSRRRPTAADDPGCGGDTYVFNNYATMTDVAASYPTEPAKAHHKPRSISGRQMEALRDAFCSAFDVGTLEQMLKFRLERDLASIASSGQLRQLTFEVIKVADREGWLQALIRAACEYVPQNPALKQFCDEYPEFAPPDTL